MGWIIDKARSWFCKHEWECLMEESPVFYNEWSKIPLYYRWVYVCKKCKRKKIINSN